MPIVFAELKILETHIPEPEKLAEEFTDHTYWHVSIADKLDDLLMDYE